jgi:multisubunit Na+/H+ antiporter MnhC subunit
MRSLVHPNASTTASPGVQRVELTPYEVADGVVHVVITAVFIGFAFFVVALKLKAFD